MYMARKRGNSIRKSKALIEFLDEADGRIKICYFPPYTPELN